MFEQFGIDPAKASIQLLFFGLLSLWATIRVLKCRGGWSAAIWLLFVWFVPLIGALIALFVIRGPGFRRL